jgi:hypothetical protein
MQIPESIEKLTSDISPTSLDRKFESPSLLPDDIISFFKKYLTIADYQKFEYGLVALKKVSDEKAFFTGLNNLFYEVLSNSIRNSNILEENKEQITRCSRTFFEAQNTALNSFFEMITILNKNKNLLDVKDLSYIITGYAISTIKKIHNS